ncbi:hypothetical protein RB195_008267 [Necator americanus]|uniref:Uncharacterized protein n=1 Tax=Necator americanus TaxID=51031 RepID=A0ABR1CP39_NECAM
MNHECGCGAFAYARWKQLLGPSQTTGMGGASKGGNDLRPSVPAQRAVLEVSQAGCCDLDGTSHVSAVRV